MTDDNMMRALDEELKARLQKRKQSLVRYQVPQNRSLLEALSTLRKAELDDIRYNLCVAGISSLKKQEMAAALVPAIIGFAEKWFATIGLEQFQILTEISQNKGISVAINENDSRIDYMRCLGVVFSGSYKGKQAWYLPDELLALYTKMDQTKFAQAVSLNDEVVRLTGGLLFYYGYLPYDQLYERVVGFLTEELEFIDFMGILINAGCWQENIINVDTGAHYYSVLDYEALAHEQLQRADLEFYPFTRDEIYKAGALDHIEATEAYKALVGFFITTFSLPILEAADVVGELQIIIANAGKINDMFEYIQTIGAIDRKEIAEQMMQLFVELSNTTRRWELKGHAPNDLDTDGRSRGDLPKRSDNVVKFVPLSAATGRNDPCPCGSGKKYKKCCLDKEI